jgi:chorismate--pyruvate lyase
VQQHVRAPGDARDASWVTLDECARRAPAALLPWLAEPGLLTARVRAVAGERTGFRLLRLAPAPIEPEVRARLGVADERGLRREIEFTCDGVRWIYARSVFPNSTLRQCPWLAELGGAALGEVLQRSGDVQREPLEYLELSDDHPLRVASGAPAGTLRTWARRAVYRLGGSPLLVTEVFLPVLQESAP